MSTATENKVQFGLKNVHYAKLTETTSSGVTTYSYATPVKINGGVNLSLSANGDAVKFYADNIVYYQSQQNDGYEGDLEVAHIPDSMYTDIWGMTLDTDDKTLTEMANVQPSNFALLFQIDGDATNTCYVLYKCSASRPTLETETKNESTEPKTQTLAITSVARGDYKVMARTTADTTASIITSWFTSVYEA